MFFFGSFKRPPVLKQIFSLYIYPDPHKWMSVPSNDFHQCPRLAREWFPSSLYIYMQFFFGKPESHKLTLAFLQ